MLSLSAMFSKEKIKNYISWTKDNFFILITVIFLIFLSLNLFIKLQSINKELDTAYNVIGVLPKPEDYTEIKNKLSLSEKDNNDLKEAIKYLESKKQEIKVITRTQTVLEGGKIEYKVLPEHYVYKLNEEIPVAEFTANDSYIFKTFDLKFKSDIVISDKNTLVKTTVMSSADNKEYVIPVEVNTSYLEKHEEDKLFDPKIALGFGISLPYTNPEVIISVPLLESPKENFSYIAPTISFSDKIKFGIIPFQYNVAKPIPLVDNLWMGVGYESDFINHYGMLNLSAKL